MGLWTSGFVLMTLLVNGPLIGPLLGWLNLNGISEWSWSLQKSGFPQARVGTLMGSGLSA